MRMRWILGLVLMVGCATVEPMVDCRVITGDTESTVEIPRRLTQEGAASDLVSYMEDRGVEFDSLVFNTTEVFAIRK